MHTINDLRDHFGVSDVKWTQNMITARRLHPQKMGNQWFFSDDEALVASVIFQSREAIGALPATTYDRMAEAMRALLEKESRRKGILYLGMDEASWKPFAPAITVKLGS